MYVVNVSMFVVLAERLLTRVTQLTSVLLRWLRDRRRGDTVGVVFDM